MDFRVRIKHICQNKGITQKELAEKLGITDISLNKTLRGQYPQLQTLERIADALGMHISELFIEPTETELTALVEHQKDFYKAETLEELKDIVKQIETKKGGT